MCPLSKGVYGGVCRPGKALGGGRHGSGGPGGALRVPVGLEWDTVGPCEALWVRGGSEGPCGLGGLCGSLWVPVGLGGALRVSVGPRGALWIPGGLCGIERLCGSKGGSMGLEDQGGSEGPCGSGGALWGSLWVHGGVSMGLGGLSVGPVGLYGGLCGAQRGALTPISPQCGAVTQSSSAVLTAAASPPPGSAMVAPSAGTAATRSPKCAVSHTPASRVVKRGVTRGVCATRGVMRVSYVVCAARHACASCMLCV